MVEEDFRPSCNSQIHHKDKAVVVSSNSKRSSRHRRKSLEDDRHHKGDINSEETTLTHTKQGHSDHGQDIGGRMFDDASCCASGGAAPPPAPPRRRQAGNRNSRRHTVSLTMSNNVVTSQVDPKIPLEFQR